MNETWKPHAYAAHSKGQAVWARDLMEKMALKGDESILDIGCGDGRITNDLADRTSGEVIGTDLSGEMIAYAQATFHRPRFIRMDARELTFVSRFDRVFSNAALHWVDDHRAVVEGIYRALKPNGKAVLQMGGDGNAVTVFAALKRVMTEYEAYFEGFESPYTFCSDAEYRQLLRQAGFSRYRAELIPKEMVHDNTAAFRGWLETTWFPFIDRIPDAMREDFIRKWIAAYLAIEPLDGDGRVRVPMMRLEIEAVK